MAIIAQILVAAGAGSRFQGDVPKQYADLSGRTILRRTLDNLKMAFPDTRAFVIVHADGDERLASAIEGFDGTVVTVTGGATRCQSVRNGMATLEDLTPDYILIHDAARPFVTGNVARDIIEKLKTSQAVAPILPVVDAIKSFDPENLEGSLGDDLARAQMRRVQTPQGFRYEDIWPIYRAMSPDIDYADDIALAREAGLSIGTVDGDEKTFKITYPEDLEKARRMLNTPTYIATGTGFDVHRTEPGDSLWLCGVEIAAGFSLKGHSDADVGLHALTDAIYGALADGDIGDHFPPTDPQWKGTESHVFLKHAKDRCLARGGKLQHVDITLICEQPKVKPHRDAMRAAVSEILDLPISRVSIKATTTEKLGFTGRGEGIAAQASATICLPIND